MAKLTGKERLDDIKRRQASGELPIPDPNSSLGDTLARVSKKMKEKDIPEEQPYTKFQRGFEQFYAQHPALRTLARIPGLASVADALAVALGGAPEVLKKAVASNLENKIKQSQLELLNLDNQEQNPETVQKIRDLQKEIQGYTDQALAAGEISNPAIGKPNPPITTGPRVNQPQGNGTQPDGTVNGKMGSYEYIPLYGPENMAYRKKILEDLGKNPAEFGPIRDQAIRRFQEETLPYIANQFAANPSYGGAETNALARAGSGLNRQLAADESIFNANREARNQALIAQPEHAVLRHPPERSRIEEGLTRFLEKAGVPVTEAILGGISNVIWGRGSESSNNRQQQSDQGDYNLPQYLNPGLQSGQKPGQTLEESRNAGVETQIFPQFSPLRKPAQQQQLSSQQDNLSQYIPDILKNEFKPDQYGKLLKDQRDAQIRKAGGITR